MAYETQETNGHDDSDVQVRLSALKDDLRALQQNVRALASDMGAMATGQAQAAMSEAMDTASEAVDRVSEWSEENLDGVREVVRTQPLTACMIALSAGALLGMLLRR